MNCWREVGKMYFYGTNGAIRLSAVLIELSKK